MQQSSKTREINSRCPKRYRLSVKKDKDDAYWEYHDEASNKDKDKVKSHNSSFANQPQTQAPKKDKYDRQGRHPATGVNVTKIAQKDKDKAKDLNHIEDYTCKQ